MHNTPSSYIDLHVHSHCLGGGGGVTARVGQWTHFLVENLGNIVFLCFAKQNNANISVKIPCFLKNSYEGKPTCVFPVANTYCILS